MSEICKSALFEMSMRRCMRCLKDASEIYPCRLGFSSSSKALVTLIQKLFIIVGNCFSFEITFPLSLQKSLFELSPLLVNYGWLFSRIFSYRVYPVCLNSGNHIFWFYAAGLIKISLLFIICPVIICPLFVMDIFKFRSKHYYFS